MKIKDGYILKEFGGEAIVIQLGDASGHGSIIELNETGAALWKALEKGADIEDLTAALTDEYDVEPRKAAEDAKKFADSLREAGVVED